MDYIAIVPALYLPPGIVGYGDPSGGSEPVENALTADDGSTVLTADDGATFLTVDT